MVSTREIAREHEIDREIEMLRDKFREIICECDMNKMNQQSTMFCVVDPVR